MPDKPKHPNDAAYVAPTAKPPAPVKPQDCGCTCDSEVGGGAGGGKMKASAAPAKKKTNEVKVYVRDEKGEPYQSPKIVVQTDKMKPSDCLCECGSSGGSGGGSGHKAD